MSRRNGKTNGITLPRKLQQELGIDLGGGNSRDRPRKNPFGGRKDRRKAQRDQKKLARGGDGRLNVREVARKAAPKRWHEEISLEDGGAKEPAVLPADEPIFAREHAPENTRPVLKSILKKPATQEQIAYTGDSDASSTASRASSPGLTFDASSRAFRDGAAQDDAEIAALEKKLGLKDKKLDKTFDEDGLDSILEGLDSGDEGTKRKRENAEWLQKKRQKLDNVDEDDSEKEFRGSDGADGIDEQSPSGSEESIGFSNGLEEGSLSSGPEEDDFDSFESETEEPPQPSRQRENPYVAPVTSRKPLIKYVPPSLRKASHSDEESLQRVRRQIQGLLNKMSEANLVSIVAEVEKLYQGAARQDVTFTLTDLLLSLFCDRSALQATFVILHAAFIAAVYKIIGTDFGAGMVSKLVGRFEEYYQDVSAKSGKEASNLISLMSHLYTFHVISSNLVFDYVHLFLEDLNERNTELLLKVVRDCGPQLRQDDPSSLKDIVRIMQSSAAQLTANGEELTVRTKFMIETITDLKNNKVKAALNTNGVAIEHITSMRKVLGTLNSRNLRASEPLRIGRRDIRESDRKGKWWLVGASWNGNDTVNQGDHEGSAVMQLTDDVDAATGDEMDLLALAGQYRMNTSVRRSIFVSIMSATDFQDAHLRLLKLRLRRSQEQEVPKVLLRCAAAEAAYNPYYTLIAKKLCTEKKMKMAFQFVLWDFFKRMGENGDETESDDEDDDKKNVELKELVNLAKMYGHLIAEGSLTLSTLKPLNFVYLKEQAKMFVELLLITTVLEVQEGAKVGDDGKALRIVFSWVADMPQLSKGLQYFVRRVVANTDLVTSKKDRTTIKKSSKVILDMLNNVVVENTLAAD